MSGCAVIRMTSSQSLLNTGGSPNPIRSVLPRGCDTRNRITPIERVRVVLVVLAMVLLIVGGTVAVAGPSIADGSL